MMIDRRRVTSALCFATLLLLALPAGAASSAFAAQAEPEQPFTEAAFAAAQQTGKPILVDTYATWCQICARQAPILEKLRAEPKFKDLVIFKVNFDTQKDVMRKFHANVQSTLIVFRGSKEVGRSTGETQAEWIEDLMEKTLATGTT